MSRPTATIPIVGLARAAVLECRGRVSETEGLPTARPPECRKGRRQRARGRGKSSVFAMGRGLESSPELGDNYVRIKGDRTEKRTYTRLK